MALTVVLALTVLSAANYGNAFEFSGLNPSVQIKSQLKQVIKPFTAPTIQPYQGDQFKSAFGHNSIPGKPFGAPFGQSPPSYQPYQPFRTNYQPFGPYPGYQGPVVYPGQGAYPGPDAYPAPSYRFDEHNHKPFGFQPFPAPAQPSYSQYKFGPTKKFNKNHPGLAEFNQPGKYFPEHQFGAYHGPEFSSAIIPAEHNIKQSKPKDILLGKPVVPNLPEFGLPKQTNFGVPSTPAFGYPAFNFPALQPFVSTVPSVKSVPVTPLVPVNAVNVEQKFGGAEITTAVVPSAAAQSEPSAATPAADPQPASPAQEEATAANISAANVSAAEVPAAAAEVPTDNEVPATQDASATAAEVPAAAAEVPTDNEVPATQDASAAAAAAVPEQSVPEVNEPSSAAAVAAAEEQPAAAPETQDAVKELSAAVETSSSAAVPANEPVESSTTGGPAEATAAKSESVTEANVVVENKPATESAAAGAVNLPGLPAGLQASQFADTSSPGLFGSSGYQYFGQQAGIQQPSFYPYFDASKLSEEELKAFAASFEATVPAQSDQGDAYKFSEEELRSFAASFGTNVQQSGQGEAHKFTEEELKSFAANFGSGVPARDQTVTITKGSFGVGSPSSEIATKIESGDKAVESGDKAVESGEKTVVPVESVQSRNIPETVQKKFNTVQILPQDDPFNGQLPLLFDPSNSGSPLDTYKFYSHPSVSALSSQASLASYSPESAFNNFGTQFRQGYLVEGSPSLTPFTKTIVQSSQTPISISSVDHPLHSQVFKYSSQSFVPYPALVAGSNGNAAALQQTFDAPSSTVAPAAAVSAPSTSAPDAAAAESTGAETAA